MRRTTGVAFIAMLAVIPASCAGGATTQSPSTSSPSATGGQSDFAAIAQALNCSLQGLADAPVYSGTTEDQVISAATDVYRKRGQDVSVRLWGQTKLSADGTSKTYLLFAGSNGLGTISVVQTTQGFTAWTDRVCGTQP